MDLVRINDEVISAGEFIKLLKLGGRFDSLLEDVVKEKLTAHAARKAGIEVTAEDVQERADQIRRVRGLHRAVDMNRWIDQLGLSLEEFEQYLVEMLLVEKMQTNIATDAQIEEYFSMHSPEFDSIEVSHIIVDSDGKANEILAIAEDDPDMFEILAREHSVADTADQGGYIGPVMRGNLLSEIEAKVFHAEQGDVIGPFPSPDGNHFELFMINSKSQGTLDSNTADEIRRKLKDEWFSARAGENHIEMCN